MSSEPNPQLVGLLEAILSSPTAKDKLIHDLESLVPVASKPGSSSRTPTSGECDQRSTLSACPISSAGRAAQYSCLIGKYANWQKDSKFSSSVKKSSSASAKTFYSLNFVKYEKMKRSYKAVTRKIQVPEFCNTDTYTQVLRKAADGLGIDAAVENLELIVSDGYVPDAPLPGGKRWSLGDYIVVIEVQARSKKKFGICVCCDEETTDKESKECKERPEKLKRRNADWDSDLDDFEDKENLHIRLQILGAKKPKASPPSDEALLQKTIVSQFSEQNATVKYCHVRDEKLLTHVVVNGRRGVWRYENCNLSSSDTQVDKEIGKDEPFQPEERDFMAVEVIIGKDKYLSTNMLDKSEVVELSAACFSVRGNAPVQSSLVIKKHKRGDVIPLLCLTPEHGKVNYVWEKAVGRNQWIKLFMPPFTAILYTADVGLFRCVAGDYVATYDVKAPLLPPPPPLLRMEHSIEDFMIDEKDVEFGKEIGQVTFGTVHLGTYAGTKVALKVLPCLDIMKQSIHHEITILSKLKHPNIVQLIGYMQSKQRVVIVTNFVDGCNLDHILFSKHQHKITSLQRHHFALKITEGLVYMHSSEPVIIHQDLKPRNILVSHNLEDVYICDLGIAKVKRAHETAHTAVGNGPGTFPYMAPEMYKRAHRGTAVDVYSLGCLFVELFGNQRVWGDLTGMEIMQKVCGSFNIPPEMPSLDHLDVVYQEVCVKCCQLEPTNRPTMSEVLIMVHSLFG